MRYVSKLIPDEPTDKHYVYSYLELIFGKGVNGGMVDNYIELLLQNATNNPICLVNHHFFQYKDVGLTDATETIPDTLFSRVSIAIIHGRQSKQTKKDTLTNTKFNFLNLYLWNISLTTAGNSVLKERSCSLACTCVCQFTWALDSKRDLHTASVHCHCGQSH